MSTVGVETDGGYCVATFFVPRGLPQDQVKFFKGRVVVSCQDGVARGDGVVAVGQHLETIQAQGENTPFLVELVPNSRYQLESDPKWYCRKVELPEMGQPADASTTSPAVKALLTGAKAQLEAAIEMLQQ